jgi:hypothetical protein
MDCDDVRPSAEAFHNQDSLESRMLGNLHVRFGVGAGVKLPRLHHLGGNTQGHLALGLEAVCPIACGGGDLSTEASVCFVQRAITPFLKESVKTPKTSCLKACARTLSPPRFQEPGSRRRPLAHSWRTSALLPSIVVPRHRLSLEFERVR